MGNDAQEYGSSVAHSPPERIQPTALSKQGWSGVPFQLSIVINLPEVWKRSKQRKMKAVCLVPFRMVKGILFQVLLLAIMVTTVASNPRFKGLPRRDYLVKYHDHQQEMNVVSNDSVVSLDDYIRSISFALPSAFDEAESPERLALNELFIFMSEFDSSSDSDRLQATQMYALLTLWYSSTDAWAYEDNWLANPDLCTWAGVECDGEGRVAKILFDSNGNTGNIPPDLALLTNIDELELSNNALSGELPSSLYTMTNLRSLSLANNFMEGTLTNDVAGWVDLTYLNIQENYFGGNINVFWNLLNLETLLVGFNEFAGSLDGVSNLVNLRELGASTNNIGGSIVTEVGSMTGLQNFRMDGNFLTGAIPEQIGEMTSLWVLDMAANQLSGEIPMTVGNLTDIRTLDLSNNGLSGQIPSVFENMACLQSLIVQRNSLTGEISPEICSRRGVGPCEIAVLIVDCEVSCACCDLCN